eukprot:TRINITY_DN5191_c0_g2_i1.p1 TRINITY_DN5191_c0_g2~~TRINITY_DN5191_c0_g2_i1.p1  ORF type:complete len:708 (-),score=150.63 TRINITY_DN5191_c0_g2_i1:30-2153(-)
MYSTTKRPTVPKVAERKIHSYDFKFEPSEINREIICRTEITQTKNVAFCLHDVLSPSEASKIVEVAEQLEFKSLESEYPVWYRNNQRVLIRCPSLTKLVWERVKGHLKFTDIQNRRPFGFNNEGYWVPVTINEVIKVSKYSLGSYFSKHIDGNFLLSEDLRSVFTVIIYLNDDFDGGETKLYLGGTPEQSNLVRPATGKILIFNHDLPHESERLTKGTKYIIRTEILFQRTDYGYCVNPAAFMSDPKYQQVLALFKESEKLEAEGDTESALSKYLEGLSIQSSISTYCDANLLSIQFPYEIWMKILDTFSLIERVRLMCVSKGFYDLIRNPLYWKTIYATFFPIIEQGDNHEIVDWFTEFKSRVYHKLGTIVVVDVGSDTLRFGVAGQLRPEREIHNVKVYNNNGDHPHYMIAGNSVTSTVLGGNTRAFKNLIAQSRSGVEDITRIIHHATSEGIDWPAIKQTFPNLTSYPWFICLNPALTHLLDPKGCRVAYESPAVLALYGLGLKDGFVVSLGHEHTSISLVKNSTVVSEKAHPYTGRFIDKQILAMKTFEPTSNQHKISLSRDLEELACKSIKEKYCKFSSEAEAVDSFQNVLYPLQPLPKEIVTLPAQYYFGEDEEHNIARAMRSLIDSVDPKYEEMKTTWENSILVTGGMSMIPDFLDVFTTEMSIYFDSHQLIPNPDRLTSVWKGASLWVTAHTNLENKFN